MQTICRSNRGTAVFSHSLHDTVDGMTLATYENLTQISATFFLVDPGPRVTAEKKAI